MKREFKYRRLHVWDRNNESPTASQRKPGPRLRFPWKVGTQLTSAQAEFIATEVIRLGISESAVVRQCVQEAMMAKNEKHIEIKDTGTRDADKQTKSSAQQRDEKPEGHITGRN